MKAGPILTMVIAGLACCGASVAAQHDYYMDLPYPKGLVPGVGVDKIEQEGGPNAVGYKRRTVQWWPRRGQDIVAIPKGVPLRTWTRDKGQIDKKAQAGVYRNWPASDPETFGAHLVGFRGFGTSAIDGDRSKAQIPAAILRMEDGSLRAVINHGVVSRMISPDDQAFIHEIWEKEYPKLHAKVSKHDCPVAGETPGGSSGAVELKHWTGGSPKLPDIKPADGQAAYPRWGWRGDTLIMETPHYHLMARPEVWGRPAQWYNPDDVKAQNRYRTNVMEHLENFWTYVEASGANMPYWRRPGPDCKYVIHIHRSRCAGGWGHCGIGDCNTTAFGHEFFHGQPLAGWGFLAESMCNAGQHTSLPGELAMFNGSFYFPWRNMFYVPYGSSLWSFVLGDNPNWGYGIQMVAGCLSAPTELTPCHTIARMGQKKGLWKNGVKGCGDFLGEFAARMVTCDVIEQPMIRSKYGMPEVSYLAPVYGQENRYRISNAEAPRWTGYNIIRLDRAEGAKEIVVDFEGIYDPELHSDWRACIVAVDDNGKARYSPLWNKGKMTFKPTPSENHLWLTVSASPSAFPTPQPGQSRVDYKQMFLEGTHAPRYPWEVTLTGCRPGTPHRKQGDIVNYGDLYGRLDHGNTFLNYPVKHEVPILLTDKDSQLAQENLTGISQRIKGSLDAMNAEIEAAGEGNYWFHKNAMQLGDMTARVKFLQDNAKGHRHTNGGGFVSENAKVAETAYVGPNAMVLDGATVKDNACIKEFAVVFGPKTVVSGNAKIGGRAWVTGDLKVSGNARILEAATVQTTYREPNSRARISNGSGEITGSAVIKGEHFLFLAHAENQTISGGVVLDYTPSVHNAESGVFKHGRFYQHSYRRPPAFNTGVDAGALYANWQFNTPRTVLLEDSYVNNNGTLHGRPGFKADGQHKSIVFNGNGQYAQAPASVADFGELTIDIMVNRSGGKAGRLFDFGTSDEECFYMTIDGAGRPTLTAKHAGKTLTATASQGIPADKWAQLRVEMNGSTASVFIDGKQVARKGFAFSPTMVFIGDEPEGNFIACGRKKDEFFKGQIDHFRTYRKIHKDFESLGPAPVALTQGYEWSEQDQQLSDEWEGRKKAKEAELLSGKYGQLQGEIKKLQQQKNELNIPPNQDALNARIKEADKAKSDLDRKIHDEYRAIPAVAQTEKEIKDLNDKINAITKQVGKNARYVKLNEEIRACDQRRGQIDGEIREIAKLKAISVKVEAASAAKLKAEEIIKQLPELRKLADSLENEKDNQKKREIQAEYKRLLAARRSSDPAWQIAEVKARQLGTLFNDTLRDESAAHAGRIKLEQQSLQLRESLNELNTKLLNSHPEYSKLNAARSAKQQALSANRKPIEDRIRSSAAYKKAEEARLAARKIMADARERIAEAKSAEAANFDARIQKFNKEAQALRNNALKSAGLGGINPYPGMSEAKAKKEQESLKYHGSADWDYAISGDGGQGEGELPEKTKKWLLRVRGY